MRHAIRTLETAALTWGGSVASRLGLKAGAGMERGEMERAHGPAIERCARRLVQFLADRRGWRPTFISLMMFRIQQVAWGREPGGTVDHRYWMDKGWLERSCTWYLPHRAALPKVILARAVGGALARIFAG